MAKYIWPRINKNTSIEEVKRIHQRIWDYAVLYDMKPKTPYYCNCAACQYIVSNNQVDCSKCPIVWPKNRYGKQCCFNGGLFSKWVYTEDPEDRPAKFKYLSRSAMRIERAKQIRDLPWKFEESEDET